MNRKQQLSALLAVVVMSVSSAVRAEPFNRYFSAQGALADVDGYDNGIAGVLTYGVRVPEMHKNFSVEGEFTTTLIKPEAQVFGTTVNMSYYTLAGYGVYSHPVNEKLQIRGRLGLLYEDIKVSSPIANNTGDEFDLSLGIGMTVSLSKTSRFILEYTVIDSDITHISAGMQFKL